MIEDRSGVLWAGTSGHGLNSFDRRIGQFKSYSHSATDRFSLSHDIVSRLLVDRAGTLWATTFDGLDRFDPATSHFHVYRLNEHSGDQIYIELQEGRDGALWLGSHSSGLQRYDPKTVAFTVYKNNQSDPTTLSDNRVNSIHFDGSG